MATQPTADEIYNLINTHTYNYYGLRAITTHPRTGKYKTLKVGADPGVSYDWFDNSPTNHKLCGVSALGVPCFADPDDIQEILDKLRIYDCSHQIVLIGSYDQDHGEDDGEIIMYDDAKVLAEWKQS